MPPGAGIPTEASSGLESAPARIGMELTPLVRRSSWSPSPNSALLERTAIDRAIYRKGACEPGLSLRILPAMIHVRPGMHRRLPIGCVTAFDGVKELRLNLSVRHKTEPRRNEAIAFSV